MKLKFLKFWLGQRLKATIGTAREGLFGAAACAGPIECIVKKGNDQKVVELLRRIKFYAPDFPVNNVSAREKPTWKALLVGTVLLLDQDLLPKIYLRLFDNIFNVDFEKNSVDGWQLCALAQFFSRGRKSHESPSMVFRRFKDHVNEVQRNGLRKCYVFGTGTSLELAANRDFSDGYRVVCNTIVRDPELWAHLKPHFIVAGDAIYHFGFTDFAKAFRKDLKSRLIESNGSVLFVYPDLFDTIVRREFSGLEHLLVPVPTGAHDLVEVNLLERFELPALGNVLNLLLLPLGCTLSKDVGLWGFDGRAPDDKLFWSNSTKHSYPELMSSLIEAHPAFYETLVPKNKESNYVKSVHGDELEMRLQRAEAKGYKFVMMHKSWTDTLQRRFKAEAS